MVTDLAFSTAEDGSNFVAKFAGHGEALDGTEHEPGVGVH